MYQVINTFFYLIYILLQDDMMILVDNVTQEKWKNTHHYSNGDVERSSKSLFLQFFQTLNCTEP